MGRGRAPPAGHCQQLDILVIGDAKCFSQQLYRSAVGRRAFSTLEGSDGAWAEVGTFRQLLLSEAGCHTVPAEQVAERQSPERSHGPTPSRQACQPMR